MIVAIEDLQTHSLAFGAEECWGSYRAHPCNAAIARIRDMPSLLLRSVH